METPKSFYFEVDLFLEVFIRAKFESTQGEFLVDELRLIRWWLILEAMLKAILWADLFSFTL